MNNQHNIQDFSLRGGGETPHSVFGENVTACGQKKKKKVCN